MEGLIFGILRYFSFGLFFTIVGLFKKQAHMSVSDRVYAFLTF